MANTIMTSKNTFEEALIMDFSPDNTQSNCLTSALNATLLTNNGNEMSLLNDMGNGRVETAYLPEGYVPVGTCQFGDIIYVVSYNPIINKSLIGCFPSPERNISSDEIGGMDLKLSWEDFQEKDEMNNPNGKLKSSSVKKILYGSKNMNPGDKYIIYSENLSSNNQYLSDYGSTSHLHNSFPKLVKVHVVSIEDSGKIVYLDSTTKWYKDNDYYLSLNLKLDAESKEDLDTHRARVNSAYSVFASKVSGNLALLVELEKITGFSCSWQPYIVEESESIGENSGTAKNTKYKIYWNFNWTTNNNNINPNGIILTESKWTGIESGREGKYLLWTQKSDGTIKLGKDPSDSTDLNDGWSLLAILPPSKYPDPGYYEASISRKYLPEGDSEGHFVNFEQFQESFEYNKYLETELVRINKDKDGKSLSTIPYKLNIEKNNGLPNEEEQKYLVNCNKVVSATDSKDIEYYTTDLNGVLKQITPFEINDDIVNNYFHYPIIKNFAEFTIPTKQLFNNNTIEKIPNISNLVYYYKIAPTMPYGILEEFALEGYIDFSKIGTKNIKLNSWKYYNYENTSTLTWGMDAYTEPGKGIAEVVFEFYDNNGFAAAYHNKKLSYNGTFTEYITLNESGSNYKLNNIPADSDTPKYHKGLEASGESMEANITYLSEDGKVVKLTEDKKVVYASNNTEYTGKIYQDDSGTLYSNYLYLVKIIIKYSVKGALDEYIDDPNNYITDYRWYWTNPMFNEYYYSTQDFKDLQFTLNLDFNALYKQKDGVVFSLDVKYSVPNSTPTELNKNEYTQLKANVTYVNLDGKADLDGNIECQLLSGLYNDYNMFNLNADIFSSSSAGKIQTTVILGNSYIESPDLPKVISSEDLAYVFPGIYPTNDTDLDDSAKIKVSEVGPTLTDLLKLEEKGTGKEINAEIDSYKEYKNSFSLELPKKYSSNPSESMGGNILEGEYEYLNYRGEVAKIKTPKYWSFGDSVDYKYGNTNIDFTFTSILYSKYYELKQVLEVEAVRVKPLLYDLNDLEAYNMTFVPDSYGDKGHFYFNKFGGVCVGDKGDGDSDRTHVKYFEGSVNSSSNYEVRGFSLIGTDITFDRLGEVYLSDKMQKTDRGRLGEIFNGVTPFVLIKDNLYGGKYSLNDGINESRNDTVTVTNLNKYFPSSFDCDLFDGGFTKELDNIFPNYDTDNAFVFLAIKDKEDNLHFVNTYMTVLFDKTKDNEFISLKIRYNDDAKENTNLYKPVTIGDAVASLLMNLYYTNGEMTTHPSLQSYNFAYLEPHSYIFTKDIIFRYKVADGTSKENIANMILLHKMKYPDYLNAVISHIKDIRPSLTDPNVSLDLKGMEKNCPLQFRFNYVAPLQEASTTSKYVVILRSHTTDELVTNTSFYTNTLYTLNTEDRTLFTKLGGSTLTYTGFKDFEQTLLLYIGNFADNNVNKVTNPYLGKAFMIDDNLLVCKNTTGAIAESKSFSINGWGGSDECSAIYPINRDEVLLTMGRVGR